ncbi:MAG: discoidin domain-containing protein [Pseudoflavonifractor sp.]|nr:discoidin domain-containing protein [Alloprevotella sp.]MCM1116145.1 discoidin domain-containing protein [Pseudoflavonifractor sp.]
MKQKALTLAAWLAMAGTLWAAPVNPYAPAPGAPVLEGFEYRLNPPAPDGSEWQSPGRLALNKEQPRATFYPFASAEQALGVLPDNAAFYKSLDGPDWQFRWVGNPWERDSTFQTPGFDASAWDRIAVPGSWQVQGIGPDGSRKYGTPIYVNQPVIFQHKVAVDDWRGGVMRTPPKDWPTYKDRNEVGQYLRPFTVPTSWDGREIYIEFDGVDSFFYLWINGKYVGFSKNSRNAARFDITPYVNKPGQENMLAVEVYRSSDGSFLESQDMFRLSGIFRSVGILSTPKMQIRDLTAIPSLTNDYQDAHLSVTATLRNLSGKDCKDLVMDYTLYEAPLYGDPDASTKPFLSKAAAPVSVKKGQEGESKLTFDVPGAKLWNMEKPYRYVLVAQLKDKKGKVLETVSTNVGFRQVEIRQTAAADDEFGKAGRYYYINGKPAKLRGVNRHETSPTGGHVVSRKQMEEEIMMMKRANINHIRNSHYPEPTYLYYLGDKYGIAFEDEANIESHEYYYGDASLSHPVEWKPAHVARNMEMVRSHVNYPSIVIWSLGNEAGPGNNFVAAYDAIKEFDTTRPVQYERNNRIVDMGSNQYPSARYTEAIASGTLDLVYPFHISEYAHSMGNAVGDLKAIWDAVESSNFICGGAIWDWIDQGIYNYTPDGTRYIGYGGDFGDRAKNDGQFVMNGLIFADLEPKPQYYEVKRVYQPVSVTPVDMEKGQIEIFNKNYYEPLTDNMSWALFQDGKEIQHGDALIGPRMYLGPRQKATYTIPYDLTGLDGELYVNIYFTLAEDMPWAKKGYVQMEEQLPVRAASRVDAPLIDESLSIKAQQTALKARQALGKALTMSMDGKDIKVANSITGPLTVEGPAFKAVFDNATGQLSELEYDGKAVIEPGNGIRLDAFRAYVNNDNWVYPSWYRNGLHNLKATAEASDAYLNVNGTAVVTFQVRYQAPNSAQISGDHAHGAQPKELPDTPADFSFTVNEIYTIYPDGSVELNADIVSTDSKAVLPRLGFMMNVPQDLSRYTWYGRGPVDTYSDRKEQNIGIYSTSVADQFVNFCKPQNMGNKEDVRWAALTTPDRSAGFVAIGAEPMSVTALGYDEAQLVEALHPYQLPAPGATRLHLDLGQTGLGGTSCGQAPPYGDQVVTAQPSRMGFMIRPVTALNDIDKQVRVALAGDKPLRISRSDLGMVSVEAPGYDSDALMVRVNGAKKPKTYTGPFSLKDGGTVEAFVATNPRIAGKASFDKIEKVATQVVFVSSEEPYEEATLAVDGDPDTYWHSMYSVTVAQFPHWIDLDTREVKNITGVTYLPRQSGANGDIKDYEIYVSMDGKEWGEPVAKGSFAKDKKRKTVRFDHPVKGQYVRFRGLSSQNGQDYGSAAEIEVLAE